MVIADGVYIKGQAGGRTCAAVSGGRLVGLANESDVTAGTLYVGRITGINGTMKSVFLDIGEEKNAFMTASDGIKTGKYKCGQSLIVQSQKDPRGDKGRQVTDRISLVGSLVCIEPGGERIYISSKISDKAERDRLISVASGIAERLSDRFGAFGISVRTMAAGIDEQQMLDEAISLAGEWDACKSELMRSAVPGMVRGTGDFLEYCVSTFTDENTPAIVTDSKDDADRLTKIKCSRKGKLSFAVRLYTERYDMFDFYNLSAPVRRAFDRCIMLPSGGSIVIDTTEALTAIDVNSGRGSSLRGSALVTNIEAAEEIAARLRLRNTGGIVVIDFINMSPDDEAIVATKLRELFARDGKISKVCDFSPLGLVELARRR